MNRVIELNPAFMPSLGDKLRSIRTASGATLEQAGAAVARLEGRATAYGRSAVSKWERKEDGSVPAVILEAYAEVCGCPIDVVVRRASDVPAIDPAQLRPRGRDLLRTTMEALPGLSESAAQRLIAAVRAELESAGGD